MKGEQVVIGGQTTHNEALGEALGFHMQDLAAQLPQTDHVFGFVSQDST